MRAWTAVLGVLALVLLAGCVVSVSPAVESDPPPSDAELAFDEVAETVGFDYASSDSGFGNGNDGIYVADDDGDLRDDVLVLGGESPVLFESVEAGQRIRVTPDGIQDSPAYQG